MESSEFRDRWGMTIRDLHRITAEYRDDALWFDDNIEKIRRKLLGKWIAVRRKRVVDSDADHDRLIARLERGRDGLSMMHIFYVRPKNEVWLF